MKKYSVTFNGTKCNIIFGKYHNNQRISIQLYEQETGEPFMTASVNMPNHIIPEGNVCIKNYSENEGILQALMRNNLVQIVNEIAPAIWECKLLIPKEDWQG